MPNCAVKSCKSWNMKKDFDKNIRFFTFPSDAQVCQLWMKACGKGIFKTKTARICSLHFTDNDWRLQDRLLNIPIKSRFLDPKAVPSLKLPKNNLSLEARNRKKRADKRLSKKLVEEAIKEYEDYDKAIQNCDMSDQHEPIEFIGYVTEQSPVKEDGNNIEIQIQSELEKAREHKIMELESKLKICEEENITLKEEIVKLRVLQNSVKNIFTKGQIYKLENPNKKFNWSMDDISSAICLHSIGPRAYKYLYEQNYPLPGPSTLREWTRKISAEAKILEYENSLI